MQSLRQATARSRPPPLPALSGQSGRTSGRPPGVSQSIRYEPNGQPPPIVKITHILSPHRTGDIPPQSDRQQATTASPLAAPCRHRRQQPAPPHCYVAGLWLRAYPARICQDCANDLCMTGSQCAGPEQAETPHRWGCQQSGLQWHSPAVVRPPLLSKSRRGPSPVRYSRCGETRRIRHLCHPYASPAPTSLPARKTDALRRRTRPRSNG